MMEEKYPQPLLVGFGNPLLDMTIVVKDSSLHKKYGLPVDGQLEVSDEQRAIFDLVMERHNFNNSLRDRTLGGRGIHGCCRIRIKEFEGSEVINEKDVRFTPGGCALNTLRVFSWVYGELNRVVFVGGIGMDDKAEKLKSLLDGCGVIARYVRVEDKPTGSCAALVLGAQRCLCADIGAAAVCRPEHVFYNDTLQLHPSLNSSLVLYLEGYFITHSFDTALMIAQHCRKNGKLFIFNLCGSYVCQSHSQELHQLLPYVDILFGYTEEYKTLQRFINIDELCDTFACEEENIVHDLKRIFKCLSGEETPIKKAKTKKHLRRNGEIEINDRRNSINEDSSNNGITNNHLPEELSVPWQAIRRNKHVVVTQGPSPLLYTKEKRVLEREVAPLQPSMIVDTTGAGDSFVGGFLAAAANGEELESCLDCGVWAAQQLLREKGCTIPSRPATFL